MEVDHIVAEQHRGGDTLDNLAQICGYCNRHKGPNLAGIDPRTDRITRLFHPRRDRWARHFRWQSATLIGMTPIGRATVFVLDINADERVSFRETLIDEGLQQEFR